MNNGSFMKIVKLVVPLAAVCIIFAGLLALTYAVTEKQIAKQAIEEEMKSNKEALPAIKKSSDFKARKDLAAKAHRKYKDVIKVYKAFKDDQRAGWVVQVAPRGYGGPLTFAVGINAEGKVVGISLIEIKETPGLGMNVEKPEFNEQFKGKDVYDPLEVGKGIDALTGATISSKAMTLGVKEALESLKMLGVLGG